MQVLDKLNNVISQLQQHASLIGITLAGLMIGIYTMKIMLNSDTSVAASSQRWKDLERVLLCAGIITATFTFVQFAQNIAGMLKV